MKQCLVVVVLGVSLALFGCSSLGGSEGVRFGSLEGGSEVREDTIVFSMAEIGSETHQYTLGLKKLDELLDEKSDGHMRIQIFMNSQLGAEREAVEGTIMGSIDMTTATMDGAVPSWIPDTSIMSIPYLFESKEEAYDALDNYIGPWLEPKYEEAGLKCLGFMELGFRHFTNNKRAVHSASDMENLIIRVQEAPIWFGLCDALGAVAQPIAINELYTALQQGVVDGQENPYGTIATSKFYEVQKYMTLDGHTFGAGSILMNLGKWNSLSEEDQELLQECVDEAVAWQRKKVTEIEEEYHQTLLDAGMIIEENPDLDSFVEATAGLSEQPEIQELFEDPSIIQGVRDYLDGKEKS